MSSRHEVKFVVGIDPGSGASSNTGIAIIIPQTKEILLLDELRPTSKYDNTDSRIYTIAQQYKDALESLSEVNYNEVLVVYEHFVMKGKGGEILNRMIGGFLGHTKYETYHVSNLRVKAAISGTGAADKKLVAEGLLHHFRDNAAAVDLIAEAIKNERFDQTDALAIALAGYWEYGSNFYYQTKKESKNEGPKRRRNRRKTNE